MACVTKKELLSVMLKKGGNQSNAIRKIAQKAKYTGSV